MIYNNLLVKYKNSWQLRHYQFNIKSDIDNELDSYDVFESKKSDDFEKTENEIDKAFSELDPTYHFEGHSAYVSVNRSKNKIFYLSRSNDWTDGYFVTLTIDPSRYDSKDYKVASKLVRQFTKNLRAYDNNAYALIVPEKHIKGGFHFHGLIKGDIKHVLKFSGHYHCGNPIFNFTKLWNYGFTNVTSVTNTLAVEKYICKYTTKELLNDTLYQHRYFTLNLHEAEMIKLNLIDSEDMVYELISNGLVEHCNTDGLYNRCSYLELKNDDKVIDILGKYIAVSNSYVTE